MVAEVHAEIGRRVKALREQRELLQESLATSIGVTQSRVSAKERGAAPWSVEELYAAAALLGVPVSSLLPEQPMPPVGLALTDDEAAIVRFVRKGRGMDAIDVVLRLTRGRE